MKTKMQIPGYSKYEITEDGVVYKAGTEIIMTETKGKVQLIDDEGKRGKRDVAALKESAITSADVSSIMDKHQADKNQNSADINKGDTVKFTPFRSEKELKGEVSKVFESNNKKGVMYCAVIVDGKKYDKLLASVTKA